MPYDPQLIAENTASRTRLEKIANLGAAAYAIPLEGEWTVGTALAHVAFWDRRALYVVERWEREGAAPSPADSEIVNQALQAFFDAVSPQVIGPLALQSAEALDRKLETLADPLVEYLMRERTFSPGRASHRNEHLDQIERALPQDK